MDTQSGGTDAPGTLLAELDGVWRGEGVGDFPTIERFDYSEELSFDVRASESLLHYVQRTHLVDGEPSHSESGFVRWLEDGAIEVSNAQNSGRVEVLRGKVTGRPGAWTLELEAHVLGHDARVLQTRRSLRLAGDRLMYVMEMKTNTTDEPVLLQHLSARLTRSS
ncbi:MAG: FABP family protein [bacterium]|nr:FABP family protein [bacterium]